jgi:hypothetical protein
VTEPEVAAADRVLARHRIRYVVIGGQAVGKGIRATDDVDVMVSSAGYHDAVGQLRSDPQLAFVWDQEGVTRFSMTEAEGERLDVLDPSFFSGDKSGEEFFAYLEATSRRSDGIHYATKAAVWYTRLLVRRWKVYAEKILADLVGGAGAGYLRQVEAIGREFGTSDLLRDRIDYIRKEMERPDLEYRFRDE